MNVMIVAPRTADWHRLKSLVLDSVSSPITKRVYNLGLDEFFAWFALMAIAIRESAKRDEAFGRELVGEREQVGL